MPKAITNEEREKIVKLRQNNEKVADIARQFFVTERSIINIWSLFRKTGSWLPKYENCGRKPKLNDTQITQLRVEIEKNPGVTISELIEKFNLPLTESGLSRVFKKLDLTYKTRLCMQQQDKIVKTSKRRTK
ncbi:MAG: IS630 transposase-related protein [Candidatus Bathyarchaeota archaeon]|nr:IS630 transposase-related protein [Candidatus Termiticorpusculum sp.]